MGSWRKIFFYVPRTTAPANITTLLCPIRSTICCPQLTLLSLLHTTDAAILLYTTDATILLHTTDATIYSRPALLTKIEQGTYITFDASAPVLIYLNISCLNTSLVFCPGKGPSFFSHVPSHRDQTYAL